jgi:hypothetical protein
MGGPNEVGFPTASETGHTVTRGFFFSSARISEPKVRNGGCPLARAKEKPSLFPMLAVAMASNDPKIISAIGYLFSARQLRICQKNVAK